MGALTNTDLERLQRRCRDAITRFRRAAGSLESFYDALKLLNVHGRTPEEAEVYRAAAARLSKPPTEGA